MQSGLFSFALLVALFITLHMRDAVAIESNHPVVLELFTSQGCSSCPPADALLKELAAADPSLVPLSFHVHYWDYLGWKDPFSSSVNTERQRIYAATLSAGNVFTPQLIVDGAASAVGSDERNVRRIVEAAKQKLAVFDVAIKPNGNALSVTLTPKSAVTTNADVVAIYYNRDRKTDVGAGENGGRMLENINNVTSIVHLGTWNLQSATNTFSVSSMPEEGLAIIVQAPEQGRVLGAAVYEKVPY